MFKVFFEDIVIGDKRTFGAYEVTKDELITFATAYDPQPFHLNEEIAKHSVFGQLCTSGWHTASMTMRMMVDNLMEEGLAGMGSPGLDELKWKKPVFVGDVLSVTTEALEKRDMKSRPNLGMIKNSITVHNQKGEEVMHMVANMMILKKNVG